MRQDRTKVAQPAKKGDVQSGTGQKRAPDPGENKVGSDDGLLSVFLCLFLADGVLRMKDNWYGWVVFGIAVVALLWLFRKKMELKELWMVDFLLYAVAGGLLTTFFYKITRINIRVFLSPDNSLMSIKGIQELSIGLRLCCIQSGILIFSKFVDERKAIRALKRKGGDIRIGRSQWAFVMGVLTAFFCLFLFDGLLGGEGAIGRVMLGISAVVIPGLFHKKIGIKELWQVDFPLYVIASILLSIVFWKTIGVDGREFLWEPIFSLSYIRNEVFSLWTALRLCGIQSIVLLRVENCKIKSSKGKAEKN